MAEVYLGLDVGEARIGLARAEQGLSFAFGRGYLTRTTPGEDVQAVRERAEAEGASLLVVGLPKRTDGEDSLQTERVRRFAAALEASGLQVVLEDERYTSQIATRNVAKSGLKRSKRREKGRVDEAAAVLILESFLRRQEV